MNPSIPILLLLLSLAAASPPDHQSHLRRTTTTTSPQQQIEVTRPLALTSLTPACTLLALSHTFANTYSLPPTNTTYSPPLNCTWTRAVLRLSGASNGSQYDRIAAVHLSGVEILRTSTPEPTTEGIFWIVDKEITKYSSILSQSNLTLGVMLENVVNDVYTGLYHVNLTFLYYDIESINSSASSSSSSSNYIRQKSTTKSALSTSNSSLELNDDPADLIIPISATGEEEYWFRIERETDKVYQTIQIPKNTYRAVIEVYVSYHGNDEFWYSNPPDTYIEMNDLTTKRGHGSYREVLVKLDDKEVGSVIPFPVVFTGGINPLFWEPVVSIGAFDLPSYEIEITPLLGMLLDGEKHRLGLEVESAISFWLVDANLHLWLDQNVEEVQAEVVKYDGPIVEIEREFKFQLLDGKFEVEGKKKSVFSGWVNSSAGNFTTYISNSLEFDNEIEFKKNGTEKEVDIEVEVKRELSVYSDAGILISTTLVKRKYPLEMKSTTLPGSAKETYLMNTELEHSFKEDKTENKILTSKLENTQKSKGWMFVQDHDVLSGSATTEQSYSVQDGLGCFGRKVFASGGEILRDTMSFLCASAE